MVETKKASQKKLLIVVCDSECGGFYF